MLSLEQEEKVSMSDEEKKVLVCTNKNVLASHDFSIEKLLLKSNERSQIRSISSNCSGRGMKRCEEVTQHVKSSSNSFTPIMTFSSSLEGAAGSIKGKKKSSLSSSSLYSSSSPSLTQQVTTSKLYLLSLFLFLSLHLN